MGLAASQARFLGITMRKAQCEFKSTELAQQKLEITNQLSQIAQDYSNGMNATRLVWSNDEVGADINLAYGLLMMPSVANDYNPYMPSTPSGAIVLNDAFAAAAKAAGISMSGGIPSEDGRDKFLAALVAEGLLSQETAEKIQVTDYIYDNVNETWDIGTGVTPSVNWNGLSGLGAAPKDKSVANLMTLSDMLASDAYGGRVINMVAADTEHKYMSSGAYAQLRNEEQRAKYSTEYNLADIFNTSSKDKLKGDGLLNLILNGSISTDSYMFENMTLRDLMSNEVVIMSEDNESGTADLDKFAQKIKLIFESIAEIFGYNKPKGTGLYVDDDSFEALQRAVAMTEAHFLRSGNAIEVGDDYSDKNPTGCSAYQNAIANNRIGSDSKDGKGYYAVSLNNMIATFLTYFANELNPSGPYFAGRSYENEETYMVTENGNYQYVVGKPETNLVTNEVKIADFYDELYNNLCSKGWRNDSSIDDPEYFQNTIKNGRYQLMSLNMDGYFYQTRYNDTGYLVEEVDKDAIARAEAEYTRKKSELTYKEDYIDLKNKNVDAEIAELNTEMESVKNMISKSVEKTFTMFSQ